MISIHDEKALSQLLIELGEKPFRLGQISQAVYKNLAKSIEDISTISLPLRNALKDQVYFQSLTVKRVETSTNGQTTKWLLTTHDDRMIECVLMRHLSGRNTLCVSSQAGCPMACSFCATGKLGLFRSLTSSEIIEQVMLAVHLLAPQQEVLRNIVFMGMGEPFLNYDHVATSIRTLCDQKKLDIANRRVTVSTCGIVPSIDRFGDDFPQTSLAISLHAPTDEVRAQIMPVERTYPIDALMASLDRYVEKTNKKIFYEYIMIGGVTDRLELAPKLAQLLKWRLAHVNFIPYNPGEGVASEGFRPSSKLIIEKFQSVLEKAGIPSTIRHTMGDDIDAACGQLALKEEGKSLAPTERGRSIVK